MALQEPAMAQVESVEGEQKAQLVLQTRHYFEQFAAYVELATQANQVLNSARLAAEAACHFLLLELQGVYVRTNGPTELIQEVRRAAKTLKEIDESLIVVLNQIVASGNYGSHFEPGRNLDASTLAGARAHVRGLKKWIEDRFPMADRGPVPVVSTNAVRFGLIRLSNDCLWAPATRLDKVPEPVSQGFHELTERAIAQLEVEVEPRTKDPVFDIVLQNLGETPMIVHRVGLRPLKMWTALKGLPGGRVIKSVGRFSLRLGPLEEGKEQWMSLEDPLEVGSRDSLRLEVQLTGFRDAMSSNELVAALLVDTSDGLVASRPLYLGVY